MDLPRIPPWGQRIPPGRPKRRGNFVLNAIKRSWQCHELHRFRQPPSSWTFINGCGAGAFGRLEIDLFYLDLLMLFWMAPRRPKRRPSGPKTPPRRPKRSTRDPRSRSRELKTLQDRPKRLEKNTVTKTMVHINVAEIAEIDKDKTILARGAVRKGRAGAGVPPWGRQSGARPGGARSRRVGS